LQAIVPTCEQQDFSIGSQKLSKAIVLQKTIDYIQFLHKEKKKQEEEVSTLRKDVMALKIMKVNYEQIVKAHQDNPHEGKEQVSDEVKFNVFQGIMDSLFQSFNDSISVTSFQELSACVFSWIEEHCKPQDRSWLRPTPSVQPLPSEGWVLLGLLQRSDAGSRIFSLWSWLCSCSRRSRYFTLFLRGEGFTSARLQVTGFERCSCFYPQ
ncbi:PREDICTED: max-like protein X, partial [Pterocles gutturalis]|uniref:max-like protein X n=1 Tax=Pterocles gutturalis TaxID=240206 RepID=UPI0005292913